MSNLIKLTVPDIGGFKDVDVIEVAVKIGDVVAVNDTLITLETEKATMDVPAEEAGVITKLNIKIGDKVSQGDVIVEIEPTEAKSATVEESKEQTTSNPVAASSVGSEEPTQPSKTIETAEATTIIVPDIGDFKDVDVIDVTVKVGDKITVNDSLITLETDKATMDVPADKSGTVTKVYIKTGDKVSQGDVILDITTDVQSTISVTKPETTQSSKPNEQSADTKKESVPPTSPIQTAQAEVIDEVQQSLAHAGPAVRKLARELGVNLSNVTGTAPHHRIVKEDVQNYVKKRLQNSTEKTSGISSELNLLPWPNIDFSQFGQIEKKPLSRIKKLSGKNLARNWVMIPHVTQHEEADMTDLEKFRKELNQEWQKEDVKISPLAFIIQAIVKTLKEFPGFNSSLAGEDLIYKKYYNIGFAADTPNGLVVPVIKNADQKGLKEISIELKELSQKARAGKLSIQEMQGASFTISSLGGIGGVYFTPIINAPEVAILGVCKSRIQPVWDGQNFVPRLLCPLSLSYDHRVIDGAQACRFIVFLAKLLKDYKRLSI